MTTARLEAVAFFTDQAGYSYDPATETPEQGKARCGRELALAEAWLMERPHTVEWEQDDCPDRSGIEHDGPLFQCCVSVKVGAEWKRESLCGIDLGPTGNECDAYMRVVVAELALELKGGAA